MDLLECLSKNEIFIGEGVSFYNDFVYELLNKLMNILLKKYIIDKVFLEFNLFIFMIDYNDLVNKNVIDQVGYELKVL